MFTITQAAAQQIQTAAQQGGTEGMALRLAAKVNQDGSIDYNMGFDEATEVDLKITGFGVDVIMDPAFEKVLEDATMDFIELDEDEGQQFVFLNPLDANFVPPKEDK